MMLTLSKNSDLHKLIPSLLEKEQETLNQLGGFLFGVSAMYILQLKLVLTLSELANILASKEPNLAEIHHCLDRINRLSRAIYLKKRRMKREREEIAFYLVEVNHHRKTRLDAEKRFAKEHQHNKPSILHAIFHRGHSFIESLKEKMWKGLDKLKGFVRELFFARKNHPHAKSEPNFSPLNDVKQDVVAFFKHGKGCKHYCPSFALSLSHRLYSRKESPAPAYLPSQDVRNSLRLAS